MKTSTKMAKIGRIVAALLEHGSKERAAAALGISTVTIWRCTSQPEFQEAYHKARREAFSEAMARAQYHANRAVSTLLQVMVPKDSPAAARVRAADSLLGCASDAYACDELMQRIEKLEQHGVKTKKKTNRGI